MKTLIIPKLDENIKFCGYTRIKVKNKMTSSDVKKVLEQLPGLPQGYCGEIYTITQTKTPIELIRFYDIRQRGVRKLKNLFIAVVD